jgi:hypothetical protein
MVSLSSSARRLSTTIELSFIRKRKPERNGMKSRATHTRTVFPAPAVWFMPYLSAVHKLEYGRIHSRIPRHHIVFVTPDFHFLNKWCSKSHWPVPGCREFNISAWRRKKLIDEYHSIIRSRSSAVRYCSWLRAIPLTDFKRSWRRVMSVSLRSLKRIYSYDLFAVPQ